MNFNTQILWKTAVRIEIRLRQIGFAGIGCTGRTYLEFTVKNVAHRFIASVIAGKFACGRISVAAATNWTFQFAEAILCPVHAAQSITFALRESYLAGSAVNVTAGAAHSLANKIHLR